MTPEAIAQRKDAERGLAAAAAAYGIWGLLPVYLKMVSFADAREVLASRILWSLPAAAAAVAVMGGFKAGFEALKAKGVARALMLSAVLIGVNWWIYVWAVAQSRVIEASLAYFMTPLVNVAFGLLLFKERLRPLQIAALAVAAAGVVLQGAALGALPWVSLALCLSWSLYGLVRKQAPVPAAAGMLAETAYLAPLAVGGLLYLSNLAPLAQAQSEGAFWLMALAGPLTAIPLILFAFGARRLTFSTLGLLQYIAPSLQFAVGVAYGEQLTPLRIASFVLIWVGLALYSADALAKERAPRAG